MRQLLLPALLATATLHTLAATPPWLETDSAAAIRSRIESDFRMTVPQAAEIIREQHPDATDEKIEQFIAKRYLETMEIDGERRVFRKGPRNLNLLNPEYNGNWQLRGADASDRRISYVDSVLSWYRGTNPEGIAHQVTYRFSIDVPYHEAIAGDTLRVWMPYPLNSERQSDIRLISASHGTYVISEPSQSVHRTIYFEAPSPKEGETAHFEYTASFINKGQYFSPEKILSGIKPYDTGSELYKRYTATERPHIVKMDSLAHAIVGDETNPYRQSELVYDYIIERYPWAGAREYSTIDCIPTYVMREGHGDCGQVSLMYISLMRTLGVPARWESGWMLHPGELNLHDWAEVYFEGVGWVPVDVSFGRYTSSSDHEITYFYSKGIDAHRMAANKGVCGDFYPRKRFVRSETVDSQTGEVETSRGNLFYNAWEQHMQIIDIHPIAIGK